MPAPLPCGTCDCSRSVQALAECRPLASSPGSSHRHAMRHAHPAGSHEGARLPWPRRRPPLHAAGEHAHPTPGPRAVVARHAFAISAIEATIAIVAGCTIEARASPRAEWPARLEHEAGAGCVLRAGNRPELTGILANRASLRSGNRLAAANPGAPGTSPRAARSRPARNAGSAIPPAGRRPPLDGPRRRRHARQEPGQTQAAERTHSPATRDAGAGNGAGPPVKAHALHAFPPARCRPVPTPRATASPTTSPLPSLPGWYHGDHCPVPHPAAGGHVLLAPPPCYFRHFR